jgi:hypothetical protein
MDEITLPWAIEYARDLPVADKTEIKQSLSQLVRQLEKLLPTMLIHELQQWLTRFEKIEQGRWKYLIASRDQAQTLLDWHKFRLDNPEAAALPASADALKFGIELGIKPEDWPSVTLGDLRERLHSYLRDIRNDAMLAALDVLYIRSIALITVTEKDHEVNKQLQALVNRAKQSTHMH